MKINDKIYVAGHKGLVGSALVRILNENGYKNIITKDHSKLDLMSQKSVEEFFQKYNPDYVFLAAAKVGGINANDIYRGQFLYNNLMIQNNVIHFAHIYNVKKLLFLGSACIYPKLCDQPIKEEYLLNGYLEPTNEPYSIAKISGLKLCENYYRQYGSNFISIMPNNLYGENDNFDLETSHVLPALIRKIHEAKLSNLNKVKIWGTGQPRREFLHVDDLADACLFLMKRLDPKFLYEQNISHINVGTGEELSIKSLAKKIKDIINYKGQLYFDLSYPDGMQRKLLDCSRINRLGWNSKISLDDGLTDLYNWYSQVH